MAVRLQRPLVAAACLFLCCLAGVRCGLDPRLRKELIELEGSMQIGGRMVLTDAEQRLDDWLAELKQEEMSRKDFLPSMHFFKARRLIQARPLFRLLEKMPKGAVLHVHDFAMVDVEWLVKDVTYRPDCYMCFTDTASIRFVFASQSPTRVERCSPWVLVETLRAKMGANLDNSIRGNLTLFTDRDPEKEYPSQDVVWNRFEAAFGALWGLVTFAPVFKDYYMEALNQFYADNVMYLELRAMLPQLYELDGCTYDQAVTLQTYQNLTEKFISTHPDFYGVKIIFTNHRHAELSVITEVLKKAMQLKEEFPDFLAGFDLVGREDKGRTLWYFRDALALPAEKGVTLPYFFHAGETNFDGPEVAQNLLDSLLLNTTRIGHGFSLHRHPVARSLSRKRSVAVEVCPISNQVLKLVKDLRNHPASALMMEDHPLVISSDDPGMFGSSPLSSDFYEAFVGFGSFKSHVGVLKQLAINSIRFSALKPKQQGEALVLWKKKWAQFVRDQDESHSVVMIQMKEMKKH